jgi:hypothetical protein
MKEASKQANLELELKRAGRGRAESRRARGASRWVAWLALTDADVEDSEVEQNLGVLCRDLASELHSCTATNRGKPEMSTRAREKRRSKEGSVRWRDVPPREKTMLVIWAFLH